MGAEDVDRPAGLRRHYRALHSWVGGRTRRDVARVDVPTGRAFAVAGIGRTDTKAERRGGKKHGSHDLSPRSRASNDRGGDDFIPRSGRGAGNDYVDKIS